MRTCVGHSSARLFRAAVVALGLTACTAVVDFGDYRFGAGGAAAGGQAGAAAGGGPCVEDATCYTGPGGTSGVGTCAPGVQTCGPGGAFEACVGESTPSTESCDAP